MTIGAAVLASEEVPLSARSGLRLSATASFFIALIVFGLAGLAAFWLTTGSGHLSALGFSGFTVPDAISLERSVHLAWRSNWSHIPNISTFLGTVLVYYPIILFGKAYALVANITLLALSAVLFNATLHRVAGSQYSGRIWLVALTMVSTNFYIISCLPYPNKEIPLIFLTSVNLLALVGGRWYLAGLSIFLSFWFRDGFALILGMVAVVLICRRFAFVSGGMIATLFLIMLLIAFPITELAGVDRTLQRNVEIGAEIAGDKFSALGDIIAYGSRLVGNAVNLGLRPQVVDVQGGLYLLGIGYWQFGIILLAGLIWGVKNIFSSNVAKGCLALTIMVSLLGISYGTFVQPRYMMPMIFLLTLGLSESWIGRFVVVPVAVAMPILFMLMGGLPPLAGV
ncbi:MAG: hypothetical protein P0Y65_16600 [Candidatus Devosia phytovorans]|uniref:Uncharacterized protein n=1 Tax=Candidatus Devosia phytovorans TaxID=3121372 RepID=A0AAJ5VS90_9HYPH|nr:hypothetical protein [Devosia sp.]WEK03794.1 MAG: hypothetical protein P0Y65_16600 [Devosia sp.]